MTTTTKGIAVRNFKDAGKGQRFEGGKVYEFDEGAFGNYHAAGLVRVPDGNEARRVTSEPTLELSEDQATTADDTSED